MRGERLGMELLVGDSAPHPGEDQLGEFRAECSFPAPHFLNHVIGDARLAGEFNGTDIEAKGAHAPRLDDSSLPVKVRKDLPKAWPGRGVFRSHLDVFKLGSGLTNAEVAVLIGLKPTSLQKYLYGKTHRPSMDVLERAAKLFQCRIGDLFSR
jgi:hypothetical protein